MSLVRTALNHMPVELLEPILDDLLKTYPKSEAAEAAKERLASMK